MKKELRAVIKDVPSYTRFLQLREIDSIVHRLSQMPLIDKREIGKTRQGESISALEIGKASKEKKTAVVIGVPHSDEPLGSLVAVYFAHWLAAHPEADFFGWRWIIIPVLERDGMRLNEGWFNNPGSYSAMARTYYREPTEDQYEWTFPIEYKDYEWSRSRPETLAVAKLLEKEQPELMYGLHHCGFNDAYFYMSESLTEAYPDLRKLASELRIPLSDHAPDVPFGEMYEPGFYKMYGLRDYIDHYQKTNPDYLATLKRGACSDEWYQKEIGGFSFNCEVPMFRSPMTKDKGLSGKNLKQILAGQHLRRERMIDRAEKFFNLLRPHAALADPVLFNSATKHLEYARLSAKQEEKELAQLSDRPATNADVFEHGVMADLFDLFFLGQIWRVAENICLAGGPQEVCQAMDAADIDIKARARSIKEQGKFYQIPIKSAAKLQLGSLLIIQDALKNR